MECLTENYCTHKQKGITNTKNEMIIKDINVDFSNYYISKNISEKTKSKLVGVNIVAVPIAYKGNEYYFAQETIDFIKYCRTASSEYSFDILADEDIEIRSLHSFDIWMPVIWVASSVLLPFAINMVSNYIWKKLEGRENEPAQVDITFLTTNGENEKYIHYSGDVKTFKETFEKIDLNRMWEDHA